MSEIFEIPWEAWGRAFAMLAPIVGAMIWWDWRQRVKSRALWKRIEDEREAFDDWLGKTVRCPACGGAGRVAKYEIGAAAGRPEAR